MNAARAPVDFWFDFSSPYSYLASTWVDAMAAAHGRHVRWHAILLGATFQAAELKPPVAYPLKREYVLRDFERSARFLGLPYTPPPVFPMPTQNAARVFWWLAETHGTQGGAATGSPAARFAQAGLRAVFTQCAALHEPAALKAFVAAQGLDADAAEAVWNDATWKARLKRANDEAVAAGVFGAPFFVIDGEPFWGHDRRAQMERWLAEGPF